MFYLNVLKQALIANFSVQNSWDSQLVTSAPADSRQRMISFANWNDMVWNVKPLLKCVRFYVFVLKRAKCIKSRKHVAKKTQREREQKKNNLYLHVIRIFSLSATAGEIMIERF